eukprot:972042_1
MHCPETKYFVGTSARCLSKFLVYVNLTKRIPALCLSGHASVVTYILYAGISSGSSICHAWILRFLLFGLVVDHQSVRAVKLHFNILQTEAVNKFDETQPFSPHHQFLGITMKIETKYAAMYVISTQLLRTAAAASQAILNHSNPAQECVYHTHWTVAFLIMSLVPQPLLYFKFWHTRFNQFQDRAKIGKELSLVFGLLLISYAARIGLVSYVQFYGVDPILVTRILEIQWVLFMSILLVILIYLPLRWNKQMRRDDIRGVDLADFLKNRWYRREFRDFLKDDVVILSFYESITEFLVTLESMNGREQQNQLKKIYDLYIAEDAPFVNQYDASTATYINS